MVNSRKVLDALPHAKRLERVGAISFDKESQAGYFITFAGKRILEFDSLQDAEDFKTKFNLALVSALSDLRVYYQQKLDDVFTGA